jgi:hypothetical protein
MRNIVTTTTDMSILEKAKIVRINAVGQKSQRVLNA